MKDNKTSQAASLYDANVHKTIPRYHTFHDETLELIGVMNPSPAAWLDPGCGTGTLIARAADCFGETNFVAADPSPAMLEMARMKLAGVKVEYIQTGSETLSAPQRFDVVTAIMARHYLISG